MSNPKDVSDVVEGVLLIVGLFGFPIAGAIAAAKKITEGVVGLLSNDDRKKCSNEDLLHEEEDHG